MPSKHSDWLLDENFRLDRKNAFDASLVIGTARFNRDTGRNKAVHQPFSKYIDPATGLIQTDMLRSRQCPVCGSHPGPGLFIKDGFRHVKCPECELIYVSLILREDILERYWQEELAWMNVLNTGPQLDMDILKFGYGLDLASAYIDGRRLLDLGAGNGSFARLALEREWEATSLELNIASAERMRQEGHQVIVKPLEIADLKSSSFDLITMWEVLEHLAEPRMVLAETRRILTSEGLVLILVPNAGSLVTRILHEKSNTFGGHSHLNHFNAKSLTTLLESQGFKILEMETILTELGTINNHLNYENPYLGNAADFFPDLTPEVIHHNLWGSRLLVLAKMEEDKQ